jgi:hypothetical protein
VGDDEGSLAGSEDDRLARMPAAVDEAEVGLRSFEGAVADVRLAIIELSPERLSVAMVAVVEISLERVKPPADDDGKESSGVATVGDSEGAAVEEVSSPEDSEVTDEITEAEELATVGWGP